LKLKLTTGASSAVFGGGDIGAAAYAEKTTLPRVSMGVFGSFRVATTNTSFDRLRYQVVEYGPHSLSATIWFLSKL
jgi:hypothetical protein